MREYSGLLEGRKYSRAGFVPEDLDGGCFTEKRKNIAAWSRAALKMANGRKR
jgi:hypothetical protein